MTNIKPSAAPTCWGLKYQDGDEECRQCPYSDTCRSAMLDRLNRPNPDSKLSLPVTTFPVPPRPSMASASAQVSISARPYASTSHVQVAKPTQPASPPVHQTQAYTSAAGYSLPDANKPNPMLPMHRPGAPSPAYYFTQYPGESVGERLTKNVVLRGLEAVFSELMQFFRHWTWPPHQ
jgi:hypothetical protein